MKKFVAILSALMMMVLAIVPMVSASADTVSAVSGTTMYVNSANGKPVNLRSLPDKSGKVELQLGVGFPVTVSSFGTDWCAVAAHVNGKDVYGYMAAEFLQTSDPSLQTQRFTTATTPFTVTVRGTSNPGRVFLRSSGTRSSEAIRTMSNGEQLTVIAYSHAWYKVVDSLGNFGYVAKAFVRK